jgi:hypothetical protein
LLVENCLKCHGEAKSKAGLKLTSRAGILKGGESGSAAVAGKPEESLLIRAIRYTDTPQMPPKGKLRDAEIEVLTRWVQMGLPWPESGTGKPLTEEQFWVFRPVETVTPPVLKDRAWPQSDVDRFILAVLEAQGLTPARPADKLTLIRRATFDLTGMPPTPEEIDAFVRDGSPHAFTRVVDRLLASPRYGERWGRHWLDVARFGESQGYERDKIRDHAWRYRDYVIHSFNQDKPYTQFVKEQLAGDVLEPVTQEGIVATGFLVAGPWDEVGATQQGLLMRKRVREEELEDILSAVGQTFLGLTVNCARCHDHKFDPIPQRDYYRLKAVFEGVHHGDRPLLLPAERKVDDERRAPLEERIGQLEKAIAALARGDRQRREALTAQLAERRRALEALPRPPLAYAANSIQPEPTFVLARGDVEKQRELVSAGGLSAVKALSPEFGLSTDAPEGQRRLKLAEWIGSSDNPLTARVMVNRVWHYHFGRGLVGTPNDFGFNGDSPSHPQLLDWLARRFIADGWSIKQLHRRIMLSSAYQQSSQFDEKAAAMDGENRLLWRFTPRRLEGEAVRDAMLAVSGQINQQMGGPSFRPFTLKVFNSHFYELTDPLGPGYNRRTVYRINVNSAKSPLLDSLDCPDPSVKMPRRSVTTTPLQALGLMNNSFARRQAHHFALRLQKEAGADPDAQIERAYVLAFGRKPTMSEASRALAVTWEHGMETFCWALLNANEFLYVR